MDPKRLEKLENIQNWEENKPSTDEAWAEDVKAESLHFKFDYQLNEMLDSHSAKVLKVEKDLDIFTNWPDVKRYELHQQFTQLFRLVAINEIMKNHPFPKAPIVKDGIAYEADGLTPIKDENGNIYIKYEPSEQEIVANIPQLLEGKTLQEWADEQFESEHLNYTWKLAKLNQSVERIAKEIELRVKGFVVPSKQDDGSLTDLKDIDLEKVRPTLGTTYYLDPDNGDDADSGTKEGPLTMDIGSTDTTLVDAGLSSAVDDFYNGGFLFNVTRGLGVIITDYVGATKTMTHPSISGQTTGDSYYVLMPFIDIDQFTENARSAGDKLIIRRGSATTIDDGTDCNFTSDGSIANPIIIESDYDNEWNDRVDLSGVATATLTFGSKTVTFSADISGSLAAGDWIYVSGDDNRLYAYEVASVVTTTVTLYTPYKGAQAGSGKTVYNMQNAPFWNTAAGDFQWNIDTDDYWKFQGLHIRGTDAQGNCEIDSSFGHQFNDCIFQGNGSSDFGVTHTDDNFYTILKKCRFLDHDASGFSIYFAGTDVYGTGEIYDCLVDDTGSGNAALTGSLSRTQAHVNMKIFDSELIGTTALTPSNAGSIMQLRNVILTGTEISSSTTVPLGAKLGLEDHDGVVGDNRFHTLGPASNINAAILQSETTTIRSGGSNKSIKVIPTANITSIWEFNFLTIFEIPIYATTDQKTYTVYMRPNTTGEWSVDPTASELYLEAEYWGHASNNHRAKKRSTETIDMNGSTSWQTLTVTVQPSQAGVLYLRLVYKKTKEAGANVFFVDPIPVIS